MLNQKNTKMQGNVGFGQCIGWAASQGYTVSIPLNDAQSYDLIIDDGKLNKVQVKTSRCMKPNGQYRVDLKSSSVYTYKPFDVNEIDYLFVLLDCGARYFIPASEITVKTQILLGGPDCKFQQFLV